MRCGLVKHVGRKWQKRNCGKEFQNEIVFVGGATVSLYAIRPLAIQIRPTQDVDVLIELVSLKEFYNLQEELLSWGLSRYRIQGSSKIFTD